MKPFIKKIKMYTLILMRDDINETKSLRFSHKVLYSFILIFLILFLAGIAFGFGAVHYYNRYTQLQSRYQVASNELKQVKVELEQLNNVKTLVANSKQPALPKNNELGVEDSKNKVTALVTSTNATEQLANISSTNSSLTQNNTSILATTEQDIENVSAVNPSSLPISDSSSPINIDNFTAIFSSDKRISISYELVSKEQKYTAGSVEYYAVLNTKDFVKLNSNTSSISRFSINYMKNMNGSIQLPSPYTKEDINRIELLVTLDNGKSFYKTCKITE